MSEPKSSMQRCRGCNRPVRETAGDLGYCKRCLKAARDGDAAPRYVDAPTSKKVRGKAPADDQRRG